jgi:hypothetical protein
MSEEEEILKMIREQIGRVWCLLKSIEIRIEKLEDNWVAAYEKKIGVNDGKTEDA